MLTDPNASGGTGETNSSSGGTNPQGTGGTGAEQNQTPTTTAFDPSKLSDEDFAKVFDDQRTFTHSRFKELSAAQRELKEVKANQLKADEERLKKQGEYQTLAEQKEKENEALRSQLTNTRIDNALLAEAQKLKVVDPDAVLKLVDRGTLNVDDTGVNGVKEALEALVKAKPYLVGTQSTTRLGSGSNPSNQNTGELKRYKHSEINDPVFYRENEKDILASMKAGLIENDL